jgi:hypothetical protein
MAFRISVCFSVLGWMFIAFFAASPGRSCCPVFRIGQPVVNADQTVILIRDPATKTEHFIRQASFKSEADDFGFLIPSPSRPELEESANGAFDYFRKLTEPERKKERRPSPGLGCGCGADVGRKDGARATAPYERLGDPGVEVSVIRPTQMTNVARNLESWRNVPPSRRLVWSNASMFLTI